MQLDSYHQPVFIVPCFLLYMKKGRNLQKLLGTELTKIFVMPKRLKFFLFPKQFRVNTEFAPRRTDVKMPQQTWCFWGVHFECPAFKIRQVWLAHCTHMACRPWTNDLILVFNFRQNSNEIALPTKLLTMTEHVWKWCRGKVQCCDCLQQSFRHWLCMQDSTSSSWKHQH